MLASTKKNRKQLMLYAKHRLVKITFQANLPRNYLMTSIKVIRHDRFQLLGWVLFVLSALFFIASSIRAGDMVSLVGGLLFLFACFVFLIPLIFKKEPEASRRN